MGQAPGGLQFLGPNESGQPFRVVAALFAEFVPHAPNFFQQIVFHSDNYSINSKGVQITGAGWPASEHNARTSSTIAAFAMWRQFHVNR